ncbi:MAG: type II secretion system F family protein [Heliobacteriaceae bacterium]|nr:type II secretion system F family protein [Heliobacteriaceae bacterium]MDD4587178.1 type II secretion system F family protein [Heliobacteriaceae bacterium]
MPSFRYKVRNRAGVPAEGIMDEKSPAAVVSRLREQDLLVIKVEEVKNAVFGAPFDWAAWRERWGKRVESKDLALFCRQFSTLIHAGIPLYNGLIILKEQMRHPTLVKVLTQVAEDLRQGRTFTAAVARYPRVFPALFVSMIEAGELGGVLDQVMERLAVHFEKDSELRAKMQAATTYPLVILLVALGAVVFILTFVMPTFAGLLTSLGTEMPWPTKFVLALSTAVRSYWWAGIVLLVGLGLGARRVAVIPKVRYTLDRVALKLPVFGDIVTKVAVSRFSRTLGTLLHSGVAILPALDVVVKTVGNQVIAAGLGQAQENIRQGRGMAGPLEQAGVFPAMVVQMVAIGEETGALDVLLIKIADYYDLEVNIVVSRLSTVLEPLMMVLLGGLVGFLVIAMFLPMFELIGAVGSQ